MADLTVSGQVTLALVNGVVTGSVVLGPGISPDRSSLRWNVTGVVVRTNRPGVAPIPAVSVFDQIGVAQGVSYDGSFDQGGSDITVKRGEYLTVTWTGGNAGDVATVSLTGTKQ